MALCHQLDKWLLILTVFIFKETSNFAPDTSFSVCFYDLPFSFKIFSFYLFDTLLACMCIHHMCADAQRSKIVLNPLEQDAGNQAQVLYESNKCS